MFKLHCQSIVVPLWPQAPSLGNIGRNLESDQDSTQSNDLTGDSDSASLCTSRFVRPSPSALHSSGINCALFHPTCRLDNIVTMYHSGYDSGCSGGCVVVVAPRAALSPPAPDFASPFPFPRPLGRGCGFGFGGGGGQFLHVQARTRVGSSGRIASSSPSLSRTITPPLSSGRAQPCDGPSEPEPKSAKPSQAHAPPNHRTSSHTTDQVPSLLV
ncbi:hypothetical protein L226DRAFT_532050 [Lentinus tigrinus ALCF2SS1-7]|uniref:uncharacterized protein n=1 Tax=Lentinus tigrinus ALCF2SS1-7 TaxID=1328758 RepID=UPI001165FD65|nr:hypothetical protein L226DRAFT_532050 [Lentinus tigrinus ALCF2SS1-7]